MHHQLCADLHTHTLASGHAYGTIREMAQAAGELGLSILGITEHSPGVPGTCDPIYFRNLTAVPRRLFGVTVLHGSEINVLSDGTLYLEQRCIDMLDYAIAGIHRYCFDDQGITRNTDAVISCMRNEKVKFISHPDDDTTPLHYPALVEAALAYGVALEVNNSSLRNPERRKNCLQNYHTMLDLCMKHRAPIIVSSDAHDPSAVGDHALALQLLAQEGFDPALLLNADADRVLRFLGICL